MPTVGKSRQILPDTTLTKKPETESQSNLTIQEDAIFSKPKPKENVELQIEEAPVEQPLKLQPPEKKKRGRPPMSDERKEELRKERAARLVAGRAKSLETRRQKALQKKIDLGKQAEQIAASKAQSMVSPPPQPIQQKQQPEQQLPPGFAGSPVPMKQMAEQQAFDYNRVISGVWDKMANYNQGIDDQALLQYGEKIRKEEQTKARQALDNEYAKMNKEKARMQQMNSSMSLLQGRPSGSATNHRVFGRRPRIQPRTPAQSANPFDVCFQ